MTVKLYAWVSSLLQVRPLFPWCSDSTAESGLNSAPDFQQVIEPFPASRAFIACAPSK
jgi:hypothetical protein